MKYIIVFAVAAIFSSAAHADIETDRTVGNCAGLLSALQKPQKVAEAIGYADNQNRAIKFGMAWMDKVQGYGNDKTMVNSMVFSATSDCRSIGIRTTD